MILQLVNSKGRVVFAAQDDGNVDHESGGGWINKPEECFLSAACTLADNPSCEVSGDYAERFITYCQKLTWMYEIPTLPVALKGKPFIPADQPPAKKKWNAREWAELHGEEPLDRSVVRDI
jgi:hypothetical protein